MSDQEIHESQEPNETEVRAKGMGWVPKEEWRGKEEMWVDADTFVERGEQFVPFLKKDRERLQGELGQVTAQVQEVKQALRAATAAIEALQESNAADVKEQVEAAKLDLRQQLAEASRDGDHDQVAVLTEKLTELTIEQREATAREKNEKKEIPKNDDIPVHPEVKAWFKDNAEFMQDTRKARLANIIGAEMRMKGDKRIGKEFLDDVMAEVEASFGGKTQRTNKVSNGNGGEGRQASGGKKYSELPAEAKAACDRMGAKLVGPNRAHKDMDSWRQSYARQYFSEE